MRQAVHHILLVAVLLGGFLLSSNPAPAQNGPAQENTPDFVCQLPASPGNQITLVMPGNAYTTPAGGYLSFNLRAPLASLVLFGVHGLPFDVAGDSSGLLAFSLVMTATGSLGGGSFMPLILYQGLPATPAKLKDKDMKPATGVDFTGRVNPASRYPGPAGRSRLGPADSGTKISIGSNLQLDMVDLGRTAVFSATLEGRLDGPALTGTVTGSLPAGLPLVGGAAFQLDFTSLEVQADLPTPLPVPLARTRL